MIRSLPHSFLQQQVKISVFNLLLVSTIGVLMRYKIAYSLPVINQKNFLNAHSHFAFAGWISQALMIFITMYVAGESTTFSIKKYNRLLFANLLTAYAMLLSFPFEGYGLFSIIFSTLSIFVSYAFAIVVWRDLNRTVKKAVSHNWIRAALIFSVGSSGGPFTLAYMMATGNMHQDVYLASIYFFLHFQYNGWFFFAAMGLLTDALHPGEPSEKYQGVVFYLFAFAAVPAYLLSALWLPVPQWLYGVVVLAAVAQAAGWCLFLAKFPVHYFFFQIKSTGKHLFGLSAIAVSIKLALQLGSTVPALSIWAFSFRPIVIGYLHLVFLGIFSIFILAFAFRHQLLALNKWTKTGVWIFVAGICLNELFLLLQGLGAIKYKAVPFAAELLLASAVVMFSGIFLLNLKK